MTEFSAHASGIETRSNGASGAHVNGEGVRPGLTLQPLPALPHPPRRGSGLTLIGLAVLLGIGALALGTWAFVHQHRATRAPAKRPVDVTAPFRRAVALLASPQAERLPLSKSVGRLVLVLDEQGRALLVVRNLGPAPVGLAYQAWLIPPAGRPVGVARFPGGGRVVWFPRRVVHGARVAVTLERAGVRAPTRPLHLAVRRP